MRVLITRPRDKAHALARELEARGHEALIEPLLAVEPVPGPEPGPAGVQAIVLTSANAVPALTDEMRLLRVFAVGEATAEAARAAGCTEVHAARGSGIELARLIADHCRPDAGALLHLCGSEVRPGLAEALRKTGFDLRQRVVYRAVPAHALSPHAREAIRNRQIDAVLLFSPRTAALFTRLVEAAGLAGHLDATEAICLSAAIARACHSLPWGGVRVAARPDRAAVLELLEAPGRRC